MYSYLDKIISLALEEDIGSGDITTNFLLKKNFVAKAIIISKEDFLLAGLETFERVFKILDGSIKVNYNFTDGDYIKNNSIIATVDGEISSLLTGERTALNFLQHLSGIATETRKYIHELKNSKIKIVDTRKTFPGLRTMEKYAVRVGGGYNHRMGLFDGVLIKDNHIKASGGISNAVNQIRKNVSHYIKIEVETSSIDEVKEALSLEVDIIMLDNMSLKDIKKSIKLIKKKAIIEISGNVSIRTLKQFSALKIDLVSIGRITHSAKSVDISMKIS